jgi:threonine synthase
VPQGKIALGKLAQALVHGARLLQVNGNFDDCLALASKLSLDYPVALVNSVNTDRLHGQKTAAFEIVEALGDAPDIHCMPVGNAGNIVAYWMGYQEDAAAGNATKTPRMFGFQAAGAAPIVTGKVVPEPSTIATAIRIGNPASWTKALDARDQSGGLINAVSDRDILGAYRLPAVPSRVQSNWRAAASRSCCRWLTSACFLRCTRWCCTVTGHDKTEVASRPPARPRFRRCSADAQRRRLDLA